MLPPIYLLPNAKMDNLFNNSLGNIWKSEKFNHFRENYLDTCDLWVIDKVPTRAEPTTTKSTNLQTPYWLSSSSTKNLRLS
jgi:hypothetical protein